MATCDPIHRLWNLKDDLQASENQKTVMAFYLQQILQCPNVKGAEQFLLIKSGVSLLKIPNMGTVTFGPRWRVWIEGMQSLCVLIDCKGSSLSLFLSWPKQKQTHDGSPQPIHSVPARANNKLSWDSLRQATPTWKLIARIPRLRVTQNLATPGDWIQIFQAGRGVKVWILLGRWLMRVFRQNASHIIFLKL